MSQSAQGRVFAQVIVDAPLEQPLDYLSGAAPGGGDGLEGSVCVVPLGRRVVTGICVSVRSESTIEAAKLRSVMQTLPQIGPLNAHWLALTKFAADYYQRTWGEVALPALPPFLRSPPGPRFASSLQRLHRPRDAGTEGREHGDWSLNREQVAAIESVTSISGFAPFLLHGVTGSGKTAVYLEAMARAFEIESDAQCLLLVPEINLTPQLLERVASRFPREPVVSLHSGLAERERSRAWLVAHEGRARIVVGTRLAVFASLPRLRLIVVDEEHDSSYKAGEAVRYSARDLAVKRAQIEGVRVVLGSATPSMESWAHAQAGRYRLLRLPSRAIASTTPSIELLNVGQTPTVGGLTAEFQQALRATIERGEQSLVFINRRGYAPVLACNACGWLSGCRRCSTFAAFHKIDATLRCHHCGWQVRAPRACPTCGNQDLDAVGQGTQRVEETLRRLLPEARIARIDRDTTRRRGAADAAFESVHAGDVDILVGTQMIAKGHDFKRVTLVGILNADAQLVSHDFRAPERLFSTLLQVAGRAGRAGLPSRVLVQTRYPQHPLYASLAAFDYEGFARQQLAERRAAAMPPFVTQALLTAEARDLADALGFLGDARALGKSVAGEARLYDPVPMSIARLGGMHRAQLLVEAGRRAELLTFLGHWLVRLREQARQRKRRIRWQIDVDPQEI